MTPIPHGASVVALMPSGASYSGKLVRYPHSTARARQGQPWFLRCGPNLSSTLMLHRSGAALVPFDGAMFMVTPDYAEAVQQGYEVCS